MTPVGTCVLATPSSPCIARSRCRTASIASNSANCSGVIDSYWACSCACCCCSNSAFASASIWACSASICSCVFPVTARAPIPSPIPANPSRVPELTAPRNVGTSSPSLCWATLAATCSCPAWRNSGTASAAPALRYPCTPPWTAFSAPSVAAALPSMRRASAVATGASKPVAAARPPSAAPPRIMSRFCPP